MSEGLAVPSPKRLPASCLYECTVMHHRLAPRKHQFQYRIFMFALDLDELDAVASRVHGFSRNRWNAYTFRDSDHLEGNSGPLRPRLETWLAARGVGLPEQSRVLLVTLPRVFGYVFNPVSFYFCQDATGYPLCAVVQVGNTFGERKLYLLPEIGERGLYRLVTPKHFYVSPFTSLEIEFDFKLRLPGDRLEIHIDDREGGQPILLTALTGRQRPLTSARLAWFTLKYPLVTLRVIFLIHWNALLLWLKRLPWIPKAAGREFQREVLHPHRSLDGKPV